MTTTDLQRSEEFQLALSVVSTHPSWDERQRTDRPMQKVWLAETRQAKERLVGQLEKVSERERILMTELLTDEDLASRAQFARDLRDDTLPDIDGDVPITKCPSWCELPRHAETGEGRQTHHEGARTVFHPEGFTGKEFVVGTFLSEGRGLVSFQGQGSYSVEDADRLIAAVEAAKQLAIQIEGAR